MSKCPWRFQADIAYGETDPMVTVFMGEVETDDDGNTSIRQDTRNPLQMKLSELSSHRDLVDGAKLDAVRLAKREEARAKAVESKAAAEKDKGAKA